MMVIKQQSCTGCKGEFSHLWHWQYGTCVICDKCTQVVY